jgi:hypothetical protein
MIINREDAVECRESFIGDVELKKGESGNQWLYNSTAIASSSYLRPPSRYQFSCSVQIKPDSWILPSWFYENMVCIFDAG